MRLSIKTKLLNAIREPLRLKPFEVLLRKMVFNKEPNSLIGKLVPNNYQYPKNSVRRFRFYNVLLEADIHDYMGHYLYFNFKDQGHDSLFRLVKESQIILDIGTNIGSTMLRFLSEVGINGFVYGFEPDPINFQEATKNLSLNNFRNYKLFNLGLGNEKGSLSMVTPVESNRGGNRISIKDSVDSANKVEIVTLDSLNLDKEINKIDLVKIDVEGFELKVLEGGIDLIKKFRPIFFIELDNNNLKEVGDSASDLIEFLNSLNYSITHSLTKEPVDKNYDFANCHFDIIAKPNKV